MELGKPMLTQRPVAVNEGCGRQPAIRERQANIEGSIGALAEAILTLRKRLDPVMRPPEPETTPDECLKQVATCEIADWMRSVTAQIDGIRLNIEFMLSHLEL